MYYHEISTIIVMSFNYGDRRC